MSIYLLAIAIARNEINIESKRGTAMSFCLFLQKHSRFVDLAGWLYGAIRISSLIVHK